MALHPPRGPPKRDKRELKDPHSEPEKGPLFLIFGPRGPSRRDFRSARNDLAIYALLWVSTGVFAFLFKF